MASLDTPDLKEDAAADLINTAKALQGNRIDLSRRKLLSIPDQLLDLRKLEFLYLEGNLLVNLPDAIFENLTSLKWVDLRNNRLSEIPRSIGKHRALKSLLLDGNKLTSLPVELGLVKTITGIHLVDNPLEFPPRNVVEQGTQEILKFLRNQLPLEEAECPEATADDKAPIPAKGKSRHADQIRISTKDTSNHIFKPGSGYLRKQSVESRMKEEMQSLKKKMFNENCDAVIQKRKDKQVLNEWHTEAKKMQRHKENLARMHGLNYHPPEQPFGTEDQKHQTPLTEHARQVKEALASRGRLDVTKNDDLMSSIKKHIATMEERRRSEKEVSVEEEVEEARRNLEQALKLQKKIEERRALEYRLRAFTADDFFPPKHASVKSAKEKK